MEDKLKLKQQQDGHEAIEAEGHGVQEADGSGDQKANSLVINRMEAVVIKKLEAMVIKKMEAGVPPKSKWLVLPPLLTPVFSMFISFLFCPSVRLEANATLHYSDQLLTTKSLLHHIIFQYLDHVILVFRHGNNSIYVGLKYSRA